jgi:hypothetical protein
VSHDKQNKTETVTNQRGSQKDLLRACNTLPRQPRRY